jgi:ferredoxin-NADP reductase
MRLSVTGFTGPYTMPDDIESQTDHIVHICAGSGSVPNFSILKFALDHHPRLRHTFIYSNKTWQDVIFRDALTELEAKNPDRLRVIHTLTREPDVTRCGPLVRKGRVSAALIRELVPDVERSIVYVCGPGISKWDREAAKEKGEAPAARFLETVLTDLLSLGVPNARIKRESYG